MDGGWIPYAQVIISLTGLFLLGVFVGWLISNNRWRKAGYRIKSKRPDPYARRQGRIGD